MVKHRLKKNDLYTIVGIVGILLSIYLALLKIVDVPCATGGSCHNVLNSKYSTIAGIPISLFSIVLWSFFLGSNLRFRKIAAAILILGSIYFTYLQVFRIDGFCIFCLVHAIVSLLTFPILLRSEPISTNNSIAAFILPNCFVLAALVILIQKNTVYQNQTLVSNVSEVIENDDFFPLSQGFHIVESPIDSPKKLLLSFDCDHCLDTLHQLLEFTIIRIEQNQPVFETPVLYFNTSPSSIEATQTVLSIFRDRNNSLQVMKDCVGILREAVFDGRSLESALDTIREKYDTGISQEVVDQLSTHAELFKKFDIRFVPQFFLQNHLINRFTAEDLVETINRPLLSSPKPMESFGIIPEEDSVTRTSVVENVGSTGAYLIDGVILNGAGKISFDKHYILPGQKTDFSVTLTNVDPYSGRVETDITYHLPKYTSMGVYIDASFPKHGYVIQKDIHRLEGDVVYVDILSLKNESINSVSILNPNLSIDFVSQNGSEYRYAIKNIKTGFLQSYQGIVEFEIEITDSSPSVHSVYFEHRPEESLAPQNPIPAPQSLSGTSEEETTSQPQLLKNSPLRLFPDRPLNENILIVSPRCPACLQRLTTFVQYLEEHEEASVPEFIWDEHNDKNLLKLVVSYLLVHNDELSPLLTWLKEINQEEKDDEFVSQSFAENFPGILIPTEADPILDFYHIWLEKHPVNAVPSLITKTGLVTTSFSSEDLTNDDFHQAKLAPKTNNFELGVRNPQETIQFTFEVENQGDLDATLSERRISSLPNGNIVWDKEIVAAGASATATVSWTIPEDYFGEAFARVQYNAGNLSFSLPVHVLVPQNGWVWRTANSTLSGLSEYSFQVRNINDPGKAVSEINTDIPGYSVDIDNEGILRFTQTEETEALTLPQTFKVYLKTAEGDGAEIPVTLHP